MKIYDNLTRKKQEFIPLKKGYVGIYACGITPSKPIHIGHAMQATVFDMIVSYLRYKGYKVKYIRNYTDVDDKMIAAVNSAKADSNEYVDEMIAQTESQLKKLGIRKPTKTVYATHHIKEIVEFVEELINQKYAYATKEGNVYFELKKFKEYGKLSGQKLDKLKVATRKDLEPDKKHPFDFALWKKSKEKEPSWSSPWGKGRPGWHIECSVMSLKHLGEAFDIHGGGADLIFPHHENEIAQSQSLGYPFAKYWVHNGLLMVGKEKMSKSLNNSTTLKEWFTKYAPEAIRYAFSTAHYKTPIQFSEDRFIEAQRTIYSWVKALEKVQNKIGKISKNEINNTSLKGTGFENFMDNDFDTPRVVAYIHKEIENLPNLRNRELRNSYLRIMKILKVLRVITRSPRVVKTEIEELELNKSNISRMQIHVMIRKRNAARKHKDYEMADQIRLSLENAGITLLDGKTTTWEVMIRK